jgi:hypothetical protein
MKIKIKIKKNILDWTIKLKRKINLTKGRNKTIKEMRIKIEIKNKIIFLLNGKIKKKNQFNKRTKKIK